MSFSNFKSKGNFISSTNNSLDHSYVQKCDLWKNHTNFINPNKYLKLNESIKFNDYKLSLTTKNIKNSLNQTKNFFHYFSKTPLISKTFLERMIHINSKGYSAQRNPLDKKIKKRNNHNFNKTNIMNLRKLYTNKYFPKSKFNLSSHLKDASIHKKNSNIEKITKYIKSKKDAMEAQLNHERSLFPLLPISKENMKDNNIEQVNQNNPQLVSFNPNTSALNSIEIDKNKSSSQYEKAIDSIKPLLYFNIKPNFSDLLVDENESSTPGFIDTKRDIPNNSLITSNNEEKQIDYSKHMDQKNQNLKNYRKALSLAKNENKLLKLHSTNKKKYSKIN